MSDGKKPPEQIKGHCPQCGPKRYADIIANHNVHESDDGIWVDTNYRILRCAGCRTIYFQEVQAFSEDYFQVENAVTGEHEIEYNEKVTYWPSPSRRKRPDWVIPPNFDDLLHGVLHETYGALDIDARVLAGTGVRTVFDRAAEVLGVDPAITFGEKVNWLHTQGKIGLVEKNHLDVLTEAGGATAHRAWEPTLDELRILMDIMEPFLYRTFVLASEVERLKARIPPKQKRQKKPTTDALPSEGPGQT